MPRKVIITGGSGFVGTNLVEHFLEQGWEVQNFDIREPRNPKHLPVWKKVDLLDCPLLVRETLAFQPSTILHFGARTDLNERDNLSGYVANIEGVSNVIEAVRSTPTVQRVVFASSQLVCKIGYTPANDEDTCPSTLYGQSKVLGERIIKTAPELEAVWTILRPTSLWGPWFGIPYKNFFETIANNLYIHPGGIKTLKQWGFIGNTVHQVERLVDAPAEKIDRKTFYLADYQPVDLRGFANEIQAAMGARPIPTIPAGAMKTIAWGGDILQKLGWKNPPLTSFRYTNIITDEVQNLRPLQEVAGPLPYTIPQGIELTVQWLNEQKR